MKRCPYCNKFLKKKGINNEHFIQRKFCNSTCCTRYHSKKTYNRIKDTKEYKKERKKYLRKWRKKNRQHFNDLCREKSKIYARKRHQERKNKGQCINCGNKRDSKWLTCSKCRKIINKRNRKKKENEHSRI